MAPQDVPGTGHPDGEERVPRPWAAPLLSTLITFPAGFLAHFTAAFSAMDCDSCTEVQADRFDASFGTAFTVLQCGLLVPLVLLLLSWSRPPARRHHMSRVLCALAAPVTVFAVHLLFVGLVDWP